MKLQYVYAYAAFAKMLKIKWNPPKYKQEEIFGVYKEELIERAKMEMRNVDKMIYLQWVEEQRKHKEEDEKNCR